MQPTDPSSIPPDAEPPVLRFAPSPTGRLHLGHVHAAMFAHTLARRRGGRFLVRLEDIDRARCRPEYARAILDDLDWLGLSPDGEIRVQSAHLHEHRATLDSLIARGLAYPCFCTRADIAAEIAAAASAPHDPDGAPIYPGTCRSLPKDQASARIARNDPHAWRLDLRAALDASPGPHAVAWLDQGDRPADPSRFGDVVLARRDIGTSYHLACTHDDHHQGVTIVTRAIDLAPAADLHVLLQALMGWRRPAYAFHRLLAGPDGARLAKRHGSASIASMRDAGATPADIRRAAAAAASAA